MATCMENAEVVKKILQNLSSTELLRFSRVNKLWYHEAQSLLKHRTDLTARTKMGQSSCQHLVALASYVDNMKIIPFHGICIDLRGEHCNYRDAYPTAELDLIYASLLDRVRHKNLSIRFHRGWEIHRNCPGFCLVKKIIQTFCSDLEEISVLVCDQRELFVREFLQNWSFPSLKTLKLQDDSGTMDDDYTNTVKALVSRAPNLQALYSEWRLNLHANLLEGSSAVHVTKYGFSVMQEIPESAAGALRMKRVVLGPIDQQFNLQSFNRITPMVLQNSCTLLNSVDIDAILLVPLMRYGISLENVQELRVFMDSRHLRDVPDPVLTVMKNFDFTRIFPRLVQFKLVPSSRSYALSQDEMNGMVDQWTGILDEPKPDRAVNLRSLRLSSLPSQPLDEIAVKFCAEMLPQIDELSVHSKCAQDVPFTLLWQPSWVNLRKIEVHTRGDSSGGNQVNFDAGLCGIDPEEAALLRGEDEEYLRTLKIVPAPSICCYKDLRTVTLFYDEEHPYTVPPDDPAFLFSKVTGLIAFKRCPSVTFTIATRYKSIERALRHMKPHASVVR